MSVQMPCRSASPQGVFGAEATFLIATDRREPLRPPSNICVPFTARATAASAATMAMILKRVIISASRSESTQAEPMAAWLFPHRGLGHHPAGQPLQSYDRTFRVSFMTPPFAWIGLDRHRDRPESFPIACF